MSIYAPTKETVKPPEILEDQLRREREERRSARRDYAFQIREILLDHPPGTWMLFSEVAQKIGVNTNAIKSILWSLPRVFAVTTAAVTESGKVRRRAVCLQAELDDRIRESSGRHRAMVATLYKSGIRF